MSKNTKANIKKTQGRAVAQDTPPLTSLSSSKASTLPSADERPLTAAEVLFRKQTLRTVVIALLIDILAFTIILPLLPRLIVHYEQTDGQDPTTLYYAAASTARTFRTWIGGTGSRLDIVLFGGFLGSLFSFLQFLSSPVIGSLSDKFGRRNVLLISMIGNGISMMLWIFSGSFSVFMWSRIIGGLTEGNVQMSIAIISDITSSADRSKTLAWVGISFALGFTVGPPIGAYLASFDLHEMLPSLPVNRYSSPALFAFALIVIETVYLYAYLPETSHLSISRPSMPVPEDEHDAAVISNETPDSSASGSVNTATPSTTQDTERKLLVLSLIHFGFLFSFSGMEFTLTFLTHDRFDFTPNAARKTTRIYGSSFCVYSRRLSFLAFTSGTVVNSLTSLASLTHQAPTLGAGAEASLSTPSASRLAADSQNKKSNRGHVLGKFRSLGQLGRSIGPLVACSGYWIMGSSNVYSMASIAMTLLGLIVYFVVPSPIAKKLKKD
ncbi:hypothetical protein BASA60_004371 [Batrachochytrium salamandrivorans]|nr:hypothetical protein BASA60_004371 [Batrachochytrium salamandrivorans]